jgi:hypothetical protein
VNVAKEDFLMRKAQLARIFGVVAADRAATGFFVTRALSVDHGRKRFYIR